MRHCGELVFVLYVASDVYLLIPASISNSPGSCLARDSIFQFERNLA